MDVRVLIPQLFEKVSLIAMAGLFGVLVPSLRNRLLGVGQPRDAWVAIGFGLAMSLWGSTMGIEWLGHNLNMRAIGIMIAAILGGTRAGISVGLLGGLFYVWRVDPTVMPWAVIASMIDGLLAGLIVDHSERQFVGWRALRTAALVQLASLSVIALGIRLQANFEAETIELASLGAQLVCVSAGVALFVNTASVVLAREANAVELVEARAAADSLSLQALRSRLEPHFLFNTLNTLRATIRTDPDQARTLVSNLADLYRYLLHHPEDASVANEIEHARLYLGIQRARLGSERLIVQTSIDDSVRNARIPALLLQPLVENAVQHGIAPKLGPGTITIRARNLGTRLRLEVEDESEGPLQTPPTVGSGMALQTLRKRLDKYYEGNAKLDLSPHNNGTLVTLDLPKGAKTAEENS